MKINDSGHTFCRLTLQIAWGRQRPDPGPEVRETYAADRTGLYQARGCLIPAQNAEASRV